MSTPLFQDFPWRGVPILFRVALEPMARVAITMSYLNRSLSHRVINNVSTQNHFMLIYFIAILLS